MKVIVDEKRINDLLEKGTEDIFVKENLKNKLFSGKKLKVKLGFDPTSPNVHIGRAITLRKLREFQDLGHEAIFIIGDFTAQIGDPSDKLEKRPILKREEIKKNIKMYKKQVGKIIDLSKAKFYYNSTWLKKLNFQEIAELSESFSIQQMSNRRNFKERLEKGEEISLREFLYPLMQGYDSVSVKADVEIGGFDQLFNLKAGRVIQKYYGQKEQDILTCQMLEGTDGRKMSSSWGNVISLLDSEENMFGKIMALHDNLIFKYFNLCTDISVDEEKIKNNPRDMKIKLAYEIVKIYHGEKNAEKTKEDWIKKFEKKEIPDNVKEIEGSLFPLDVLFDNKLIKSKGEGRRLFEEGAIFDLTLNIKLSIKDNFIKGNVYRIGKHNFIKIK